MNLRWMESLRSLVSYRSGCHCFPFGLARRKNEEINEH